MICLFLTAISGLMLRSDQSQQALSSDLLPFIPLSGPQTTLEVDSDDSDDWVNAEIQAEGREVVQSYRYKNSEQDEVLNILLVNGGR